MCQNSILTQIIFVLNIDWESDPLLLSNFYKSECAKNDWPWNLTHFPSHNRHIKVWINVSWSWGIGRTLTDLECWSPYFSRAESRHTRSQLLSRETPVSLYMHFTAILRYLCKWEYFTIGKRVSEMDTHYEEPCMNFFQTMYSKKVSLGKIKTTIHCITII